MMTDPYQLRGYIVSPISIDQIRTKAMIVRDALGLGNDAIDLEVFLERLSSYGITIDVVDDVDMPGFSFHSEACCIPETATIYLTELTYEKACSNDPRTRFTIFHELGHLILGHSRELHRGNVPKDIKPYVDSEWQADQFSAEMTMPLNVILELKLFDSELIRRQFGVSEPAARRRYEQLKNKRLI